MSAPIAEPKPYVLFEYYVDPTPKYAHRILPNQPEFEALLPTKLEDMNIALDRIKATREALLTIFISSDYTFLPGNTVHFNTWRALSMPTGPLPLKDGLTEEITKEIDYLMVYTYKRRNPADPLDESYGPDMANQLADQFSVYGYEVDWSVLLPSPAPEEEEIGMKTGSFVAELLAKYPCPAPEDFNFDIDHKTWTQLVYARAKKKNVLLVGPTGTGKTEIIDIVAKVMGEEVFIQDMGTIQDAQSSLLGVHRIDEHGHSLFDPAPFVDYIKSGHFVLMDEINRGPLSVQNMTFPCLDRRRYLPLDMAGAHEDRHIKLHEDTWMVGTANIGAEYGATNSVDRAFKDRFQIIECTYMSAEREINILQLRCPGLSMKDARSIVAIAVETREMAATNQLSEAISTRHTIATAEQVVDGIDLVDALTAVVLPLFEDDASASEREKVRALMAGY